MLEPYYQIFKDRLKKVKFKSVNTRDLLDATVYIGHESGTGAGLIINKDGTILTNWHVIENANQVWVYPFPKDPSIRRADWRARRKASWRAARAHR